MSISKIFFTAALIIVILTAQAVDFSKLNTAYWYDYNAPLRVNSRVVQNGEDMTVIIELISQESKPRSVKLTTQADYNDTRDNALKDYIVDTLLSTSTKSKVQLMFTAVNDELLVLRYTHEGREFFFPINLKRGKLSYPSFYPVDKEGIPIATSYLNDVKIDLENSGEKRTFYFFQYAEDFDAADPPMGSVRTVSPSLLIDSLFSGSGKVSLKPNHFYFIQTDTLSNQGLTVYCGPKYYPSGRLIEELIYPMRYFTRSSEMTRILGASNPRKEFESYWLKTFGSKELARSAIRSYYRTISESNELFTDYKQGWKTDRGLLFVIFGTPDEVYRTNRKEFWKYPDAEFEFRIISNLFAPSLYVLMRDKDYEDAWIRRINILREGL